MTERAPLDYSHLPITARRPNHPTTFLFVVCDGWLQDHRLEAFKASNMENGVPDLNIVRFGQSPDFFQTLPIDDGAFGTFGSKSSFRSISSV